MHILKLDYLVKTDSWG